MKISNPVKIFFLLIFRMIFFLFFARATCSFSCFNVPSLISGSLGAGFSVFLSISLVRMDFFFVYFFIFVVIHGCSFQKNCRLKLYQIFRRLCVNLNVFVLFLSEILDTDCSKTCMCCNRGT